MKALIVTPGSPHSARLASVDEPSSADGLLLVETVAVDVCGTDMEIVGGLYGTAPPGQDFLVLGHEALGRTGVSSGGRKQVLDMGLVNRYMVLENDVVFGSVNANRRHYEIALRAMENAPIGWLEKLITRRVPFDEWESVLVRRADDVKPVLVCN